MPLPKRFRDIALGLGALVGLGVAAERVSSHEPEIKAERKLTKAEQEARQAREEQTKFFEQPEVQKMLERQERERFAKSNAGHTFTRKNLDRLRRVFGTPPANNPTTRETQLKIRSKTLTEAVENIDLALIQDDDRYFVEEFMENATAEELREAFKNPHFTKAANQLLTEQKDALYDLKQPGMDEGGRTFDRDNAEDIKEVQAKIRQLENALKPTKKTTKK